MTESSLAMSWLSRNELVMAIECRMNSMNSSVRSPIDQRGMQLAIHAERRLL